MPTKRVNIHQNDKIHFITLTIKHWYYIFDRHNRWNILSDSLKYCQEHKALKIYAFLENVKKLEAEELALNKEVEQVQQNNQTRIKAINAQIKSKWPGIFPKKGTKEYIEYKALVDERNKLQKPTSTQ